MALCLRQFLVPTLAALAIAATCSSGGDAPEELTPLLTFEGAEAGTLPPGWRAGPTERPPCA